MNGRLFSASSELNGPPENRLGRYGPHNLFDRKPETCWAEGVAGNGIGETIHLKIEKDQRELFVQNGYCKSPALYKKNGRVRSVSISLLAGINPPGFATERALIFQALPMDGPYTQQLKDSMAIQRLPLGLDWKKVHQSVKDFSVKAASRLKSLGIPFSPKDLSPTYIVRLEIKEVYPGSRYPDTCLSGISFPERPKKIYLSKNEDAILVDTDQRKGKVLVRDKNSVFMLIDQTSDHRWLIAHKMPRQGLGVSVEVEEMLFQVAMARRVDPALLGAAYPQFYGFKNNMLQYGKGAMDADAQISLNTLQRKIEERQGNATAFRK